MFRSPSGFQIIVWQILISVICGITLAWGVDRVWMKIFDHRKLFPGRREEAVPKKDRFVARKCHGTAFGTKGHDKNYGCITY